MNLASRIMAKCQDLDTPLLMLAPFVYRVAALGAFERMADLVWVLVARSKPTPQGLWRRHLVGQ
jgi:hypothetical protein